MTLEDFGISVRAYSCLKGHGVNTTEQLCNMSMDDMMRVRNLGRRSLEEVLLKMKELGLEFKGE